MHIHYDGPTFDLTGLDFSPLYFFLSLMVSDQVSLASGPRIESDGRIRTSPGIVIIVIVNHCSMMF